MTQRLVALAIAIALSVMGSQAAAQEAASASRPVHDAALAKSLGADKYGMRGYVLVILKTGPNKVAAGAGRDDMFNGHFANMTPLVADGKLALPAGSMATMAGAACSSSLRPTSTKPSATAPPTRSSSRAKWSPNTTSTTARRR
ncbi:MAG: hypothetical protein M3Z16_11105 [Pseudomonadota bacterium]|nr:hypothetical protein [Pseudomonadota bacterium]